MSKQSYFKLFSLSYVHNGNEGVLRIRQISSVTGTSPSEHLMSYPGHSLYFTALDDWAMHKVRSKNSFISDNLF